MLPEETIAEVLGDCEVPGVGSALKHMFKISREGMEGTLSLMSTRLVPSARAPSGPAAAEQAWEGLSGSRAERRVRTAIDPAPGPKVPRRTKQEDSLKAKLTDEMQRAIEDCFRVLDELGAASPRYERIKYPTKGQEEG